MILTLKSQRGYPSGKSRISGRHTAKTGDSQAESSGVLDLRDRGDGFRLVGADFFVAAGYRRCGITHGGFAGGKFPFVVRTVS